jgi:hypothetical protein
MPNKDHRDTRDTNKNEQKPSYTDPVTGKFAEGNPGGGRPKGSVSIVEGIKKKLEELAPGEDVKTYRDIFIEKIFEKANKDGDVQMMKDVINRVDGMPQAHVDLTTDGEKLPTPIYSGQSIQED